MKKQEKEKIFSIIKQCRSSFQSWDKKSTCVFHLLDQINGLKSAQWELFELPNSVREKGEEKAKLRLYEELDSLSGEIAVLTSLLQELKRCTSSSCSSLEGLGARAFECSHFFDKICHLLYSIIRLKQIPLKVITIDDQETFQYLTDSNISVVEAIKEFEENVELFQEFVVDA